MLRVIDCSAMLEIPHLTDDVTDVLLQMGKMVVSHDLTFCNEVVHELERRAKGEPIYLWAKTVSSDRCDVGSDFVQLQATVDGYPAIVDTEDPLSSAAATLAQARENLGGNPPPQVITAEMDDKILRAGLRSACAHYGIDVISVEQFLNELTGT